MAIAASVHLPHNQLVPESERYLTVQEVADRYGLSKLAVYRMLKNGELPGINLSPPGRRKRWRIKLSELEGWEHSHTSGTEET